MANYILRNITAGVPNDDNPPQLWIDILMTGKVIVALNANAAKTMAQAEVDAVNAGLDEPYAAGVVQINVTEIKANV